VVAEPMIRAGAAPEAAISRARSLLDQLAIPARLWRLAPSTFSGGEQQRVNIARGFAYDYPILLLDEPTSSMDFTTEAQFKERLREFARHKTMVIVTHRTSLIDLATRIIVVDGGRVVADGPREQVISALQSGRVGRAS